MSALESPETTKIDEDTGSKNEATEATKGTEVGSLRAALRAVGDQEIRENKQLQIECCLFSRIS
jgi:hypothetical protein